MSDPSVILGLPYIQAAQAQKHITHNEALRQLDVITQLSVTDDNLTIPPGTPDDGARYIVGVSATGDWAAQDGKIALFETGTWQFFTPLPGWRAWVETAATWSVFDGAAWIRPLSSLSNIERFGLNATANATTPFVAQANQALWDAQTVGMGGTGNMIQSINRESASDDAGLALQTDYTTQALFGFFGGSALRLSVSTDGASFADGFAIDPATGIAAQPSRPRFKAVSNYDNTMPLETWITLDINQTEINDQGAFDAATNLFTAPVTGSYMIGGGVVFKRDISNDVRMQMRMLLNGTSEIAGSFLGTDATATNEKTGVQTQTMAQLNAGDTVALQALYRRNAGFTLADKTAFWGYLVP